MNEIVPAGEPVETALAKSRLSPSRAPSTLAEHEKARAYPEAVEQAHADFATLQAST